MKRYNGTEASLVKLLDDETYIPADKAKEWGMADSVYSYEPENSESKVDSEEVEAMTRDSGVLMSLGTRMTSMLEIIRSPAG